MKKVVLTQEQANAIEAFRILEQNNKQILKYNFHKLPEIDKDTFAEPINEMDFDTLVKALYIGYEVEPEFKEKDWIAFYHEEEEKEIITTIHTIEGKFVSYIDGIYVCYVAIKDIRHATQEEIAKEKERRWWEKHNRDVWELKEGDVLDLNGHTFHIVDQVDDDKTYWLVSKDGPGTATQEILKNEDTWDWRVVYFSEDRKDV